MKKLFLACLILLVSTSFVFANDEVIVEKNGNHTNYVAKKDPVRFAMGVANLPDEEKAKLWAYVQENHDKVPATIYMALADYIYKKNKDEAIFWYMVGRIRTTQDVIMCDDESNTQQMAYYPRMAPNTLNHFSKNMRKTKAMVKKAVEWDKAHPERINPEWACYHGMNIFMYGQVFTKPMEEYEKVKEEYRQDVLKTLDKY